MTAATAATPTESTTETEGERKGDNKRERGGGDGKKPTHNGGRGLPPMQSPPPPLRPLPSLSQPVDSSSQSTACCCSCRPENAREREGGMSYTPSSLSSILNTAAAESPSLFSSSFSLSHHPISSICAHPSTAVVVSLDVLPLAAAHSDA